MQHRDFIIIKKVISELEIGIKLVGDHSLEEFVNDEVLKRATAMTVINVGELIKNVTQETRKEYSDIPWRVAAGMRDIVAHKYQTLRMEDVYNTVKNDFPQLLKELKNIINLA